ncbi:general transcription factor IIF subunit 2-like [Trichogramma pretiosum]|uniref:general transcription factor IIF subunit 2-like n=1 Tax=Trichogramma pretiosum TaxID=7493 RepID=UPI0006C9DC54|nr:general transcription factor IIF subunit 2-like [Trichogramma pretiosum]
MTKSSSSKSNDSGQSLDLTEVDKRVCWLVKVPKYVADRWDRAPGRIEVAKLKIAKHDRKKPEVSLKLSEAALALKEPDEQDIPEEHKLDYSTVVHQTIGVFSEIDKKGNSSLCLEGKIVTKMECHPNGDDKYMQLKMETIREAAIPARKAIQLEHFVQTYKPVSNHKHNIEYDKRKKSEGKKMRGDKDTVLSVIFKAFESHQYYNIKDLVKKTNQPVGYLKEILNEVCNYNVRNPHKNMWELKPEYRHYS